MPVAIFIRSHPLTWSNTCAVREHLLGLLAHHRAAVVQARAEPAHLVGMAFGGVGRELDADPGRVGHDERALAVVLERGAYDFALGGLVFADRVFLDRKVRDARGKL